MLSSAIVIMPVSAKNPKLPSGADRVDYLSAGGTIDITLTAPLPENYPPSATIMRLKFIHAEFSKCENYNCHRNCHQGFDSLLVFFYMKLTGATEFTWQPFAVITDSRKYATFCETLWTGTLMRWDVPPNYPYPAVSTNNVIHVCDDVLSVERHGTCVKVRLSSDQQLMRPTGVTFTLPAFCLKLYRDGAFVHEKETIQYTGWTGASGYTFEHDDSGFISKGVFKSNGALITGATSNAVSLMHGTHTYFPPV